MFGFFNSRKALLDTGLLQGAVDNHSHILYGLDDGVSTLDESLAVMDFLEKASIDTLWFTPHTMEDVRNTTAGLKSRFEEFKSHYKGNVKLKLASEYMMDTLFLERLRAKDLLLHGQDRVLVETSTWSPPIDFWDILDEMMRKGYRPLIAHPERYRYMNESDYKRLHDMGALLQLNLPSLLGVYGETAMNKAFYLLEKGWYCMVGSDCHRLKAIEGQYHSKMIQSSIVKLLEPLMMGLED